MPESTFSAGDDGHRARREKVHANLTRRGLFFTAASRRRAILVKGRLGAFPELSERFENAQAAGEAFDATQLVLGRRLTKTFTDFGREAGTVRALIV